MSFASELIESFKKVFGKAPTTRSKPNPWPKCPACYHRVPALCCTAEEGAEPCGDGLACGCCGGPHLAPKKEETS